ncbi:MAG: hypothetical protein WC532_01080 [Candidatus Omnitrophota bacterium]
MRNHFIFWLCVACLLVFAGGMNNGFVFDDKALIVHNPFIKSLKLLPEVFNRGIYDHWITAAPFNRMYRPLQTLSYWLDYRLWGLDPFGFRLTNILLHLLNTILVYCLLSAIFKAHKALPFTAILFLVHPLNAATAVYISARADLLSCLFMLLSMLFFLKYLREKPVFYIFSLLAGAAALLCRENALIMFLYIALILFVEKRRLRDYRLVIPFILLGIFYFIIRFLIFGPSGLLSHPELLTLPMRLANFSNILLRYLLLLFMPLDLRMLRSTAFITNPVSSAAWLGWSGIFVFVFLALKFRDSKTAVFSAFWFIIGCFPVFFLLDGFPAFKAAMMAENWVYISSAGFFMMFCVILQKLKKINSLILTAFIIFYSSLSLANNVYLRNNLLVHKRILEYGQEPNPVRKDLIDDYLSYGMYGEAFREAKRFCAYQPAAALSDVVWGNFYFSVGRINKAQEYYEAALAKTGGRNFFLYYRLSLCYKIMGKVDVAFDAAMKSFHANPYFEPNLKNLTDLTGK